MSIKKILLIITGALLALVLLLGASALLFRWNIRTHTTLELDGYTIRLRGGLSSIRQLKIKDPDGKTVSLPCSADSALIKQDKTPLARFHDLNRDGYDDLLIVTAIDADEDIHECLYLFDTDKETFVFHESLSDLAGIMTVTGENGFYTHSTTRTYLEEPTEGNPPIYEERKELSFYLIEDDMPIEETVLAVTYYSENDIYCYSHYALDDEGEMTYVDEKWFEENEKEDYLLPIPTEDE